MVKSLVKTESFDHESSGAKQHVQQCFTMGAGSVKTLHLIMKVRQKLPWFLNMEACYSQLYFQLYHALP